MCQLYDHSDWQCANEWARCVGGAEYCVHFVFLCTLFLRFLFTCFGALARDCEGDLLHLMHAQNVHAAVELAARQSRVFNATFLLNGSDESQRSGRIEAAGCWFESGWCVGAFTLQTLFSWVKLQRQVKSKEEEITWFNHFTSSSIDQKILVSYICRHSGTLKSWCCDVMMSWCHHQTEESSNSFQYVTVLNTDSCDWLLYQMDCD